MRVNEFVEGVFCADLKPVLAQGVQDFPIQQESQITSCREVSQYLSLT